MRSAADSSRGFGSSYITLRGARFVHVPRQGWSFTGFWGVVISGVAALSGFFPSSSTFVSVRHEGISPYTGPFPSQRLKACREPSMAQMTVTPSFFPRRTIRPPESASWYFPPFQDISDPAEAFLSSRLPNRRRSFSGAGLGRNAVALTFPGIDGHRKSPENEGENGEGV